MKNIFRIIEQQSTAGPNTIKVAIGIDLRIGNSPLECPVTETVTEYSEFSHQIDLIQEELEKLRKEARSLFYSVQNGARYQFPPTMSPQEIWEKLVQIENKAQFVDIFNSLPENRRKDIAEYVFGHCNVFSGKGSLFSTRYNNKSMLLE